MSDEEMGEVEEVEESAGAAGDDSGLVKQLRQEIRDRNRQIVELEGQLEGMVPADEAEVWRERAERFADERWRQAVEGSGVPEGLAEFVREKVDDAALIDDAEGVRAWLTDLVGERGLPAETRARMTAQRQIDDARSTATPIAGQKMSAEAFRVLTEGNGAAAVEAYRSGRVDFSGEVGRTLEANRDARWLGGR